MEFWKEIFLSGLPTLFAEKVKTIIRNKYGRNKIAYDDYTCGELISECIGEG